MGALRGPQGGPLPQLRAPEGPPGDPLHQLGAPEGAPSQRLSLLWGPQTDGGPPCCCSRLQMHL